ncbi:hypothetical protein G6F70_006939 [Rhizopus microsporus]|uniref:SH3 domain-containing protein n=1 Tax=Rhizopus microsporus TaxID=58291 RepID=A0A1X0RMJ5_RHIZD|nr:hypothetical protein G6F71_006917 [Rhizopus microsporus]KAG1197047.1 hypothetical protein G6F70_006939 [Rhizopus microsporus]KAG1208851.1 hypothetical protein G6F69_006853 [Rhizopus microsporus]KAG1230241.1 hypothetical protein G6F67_006586 [Rhizopus microsporus]KAG1262356.1 hypothetical protein G6F68_005994 [Rhizopus microsporus]
MIFYLILLLLFYTQYIDCQQCLPLKGSKACPLFSKISIPIDDTTTYSWLTNVSNVNDFDRELLNYVNSPLFWNQELNCAQSIQDTPKYAISFTCATIVSRLASSCNTDTAILPLCQHTCDSFSKSIQTLVRSHNSTCSLASTDIASFCETDPVFDGLPSAHCISGFDNERQLCESKDADVCKYCDCPPRYNNLVSTPLAITMVTVVSLVICASLLIFLYFRCYKQRITHLKLTSSASLVKVINEPHAGHVNDFSVDEKSLSDIKGHVFQVNSIEEQYVRAIYSFTVPNHSDELQLLTGDILRMYYYFDDGWAIGDNLVSGQRGLFPLLCVVHLSPAEVHELIKSSENID